MAMRQELPERAQVMGQQLRRSLLPSTRQLWTGSGLSEYQAKRGVRDLIAGGFVAKDVLGCLLPGVPRQRFMESGLEYLELSDEERSLHGPDGLGNLIRYDLPKVEAMNAVSPFYATEGWEFYRVHWYEREPFFTATEYRHPDQHRPAYLPFCWASTMDTQRELAERLEALPEAVQAHSVYPDEKFWPAGLTVVGADEWAVSRAPEHGPRGPLRVGRF